MSLVELRSLNLSGNGFTGLIPDRIGDMKELESLDLSRNSLTGQIPNSFKSLYYLSYLNLSYNKLVGRIPESTQLQTFNASSFMGNDLCGPPLTSNCSRDGDDDQVHPQKQESEGGEKSEIEWFYVFLSSGCAIGFSSVCTALALKKSWRDAYFGYLECIWNKLYVYFCVKWARLTKQAAASS